MQYDPKEFKKYPEVMSKEQLYKVCHVAKRTATYLLQSGLIPNTYTGKQTRCYQIKKSDVIAFLEDREVDLEVGRPEISKSGSRYQHKKVPKAL